MGLSGVRAWVAAGVVVGFLTGVYVCTALNDDRVSDIISDGVFWHNGSAYRVEPTNINRLPNLVR